MDGSAIPSTSKEPKEDLDQSDASDESGPPVLQRVDSEYYAEQPDCDDTEPCPLSAEPSTSSVFREDHCSNIDQVCSEDEDMKPSTSDKGSIAGRNQTYSYIMNSNSAIQCFTCILCQKICNDAFVVYCSYLHRFCKNCIISRWESGNHFCPRCGEDTSIKPEQDETWNQLIDQFRLNTDIVLAKDINRTPETSESESDIEQLPEESDEAFTDRRKNFYRRKDIREIQKRLSIPPNYDNILLQNSQLGESSKYFFKPHQSLNTQNPTHELLKHLNYKSLECNQGHQFPHVDVQRTILGKTDANLFTKWKHFKKVARGMKNVNAVAKHKKKTLLMQFAKKNGLENYVECTTSDDDSDDSMVKPTIESIKQLLLERKASFQETTSKPQAAVKNTVDDCDPQPSTSRLDPSDHEMQDDMQDADSSRENSRLNFTSEIEERPRSARSEDERATREPTELESDTEATRDGIYDNSASVKVTNDTPPKEKVKRPWTQQDENQPIAQESIEEPKNREQKKVTMKDYNQLMMEYIKNHTFGGTYNIEEDNQLGPKEKEERMTFMEEHKAKMLAVMKLAIEGETVELAPKKKESILLDLLEQPSLEKTALIPISLVRLFDHPSRVPRCDFKRLNIQVQANIRIGHLVEFMYSKIANHYSWKVESVKKYIEINFFEINLSDDQDEDLDLKRCKEARSKKRRPITRNILNRKKFFNSLTENGEPKPKKEMKFRIPAYLMNPHPFEKGFCLPSKNGLVAFGDEVQLLSLADVGLEQYCSQSTKQNQPKVPLDRTKESDARPIKEPQIYRPLAPKPRQVTSNTNDPKKLSLSGMETMNMDQLISTKKKRHSSGGANSTPSTASACSTPGSSIMRKRRRKKTDPETDDETEKEHYIPPHLHPDKSNPNFGSGQQPYLMPPVLNEETPSGALSRGHHSTGSLPNAGTEQNHVNASPSAPPVLQNEASKPPVLTPMTSVSQQRQAADAISMANLQPVKLPPGYCVRTMPQDAPEFSPILNIWNRKGQAITKLPTTFKFRGMPAEFSGEMTVREVAIKSVENLMEQVKDHKAPTMLHERILLNKLIHNDSPEDAKKSDRLKVPMPKPRKVRALKISRKYFPSKSNRKLNWKTWEALFHQIKHTEHVVDASENDIQFAKDHPNLLERMKEIPEDVSTVDRSPNKLDTKPTMSLEQLRKKARLLEQQEKAMRRKQKMQDRQKYLAKRDLAHIVRYKRFTRSYRRLLAHEFVKNKNNSNREIAQSIIPEHYIMAEKFSAMKPSKSQLESPHKHTSFKPGQRVILPKVDTSGQEKLVPGSFTYGPSTSSSQLPGQNGMQARLPPNLVPSQTIPNHNNAQIVIKDTDTGPQQYVSITVAGKEQLIPIQQSQNGQIMITANLAEIVQQATTTGTVNSKGNPLPAGPSLIPVTSVTPTTSVNVNFGNGPQQVMMNSVGFPRTVLHNGQPIILNRVPHQGPSIPMNQPQYQITTIPTNSGPKQFVITRTAQGEQYTQIPSTSKPFEVPTAQKNMNMMAININGRMTVRPILSNGPPMQIAGAGSPMKIGPQMVIPPNLVPVATHPGQVVRLQSNFMQLGGTPRNLFTPNTLIPIQQSQIAQAPTSARSGPDSEPYTGSPVPVLYEKGVSPEPQEKQQDDVEHLSTTSDVPPSLSPAISVEGPESSQSDGNMRKKSATVSEPSTSKEKSITSESDSTDKREDDNSNGIMSTSSATKRKRGRPPKKFIGFYTGNKATEAEKTPNVNGLEEVAAKPKDSSETPTVKATQLHPDLSPPENNETLLSAPTTYTSYETPNKVASLTLKLSPKTDIITPHSDTNLPNSTPPSSSKIDHPSLKRKVDVSPKYTPVRYPHGIRKKKKLRKTKKVYREPSADNARLISLDGRYHRLVLKYPMQALSQDTQIAELHKTVNLSPDDSFVLVFSIRSRNDNTLF